MAQIKPGNLMDKKNILVINLIKNHIFKDLTKKLTKIVVESNPQVKILNIQGFEYAL
jgi:hypothetical protein